MASNGYPQQGEIAPPQNSSASQTSSNTQTPDHVGWCFVKQYYTVLAESPDKLNLFYHKNSSLVWGTEGEVQPMLQGRHEISEQIKALNFKDCQFRVTNVDSQGSAGNGILIQVMGQMTNDQGPPKRFVQTFFLAEQQNGYYVLNDIFRYLMEEEEEEALVEENAQEEAPPDEEQEAVPEPEPASVEDVPVEEPVQETEETVAPAEAETEPEPVKAEEPITIAPAVPEIPVSLPTVSDAPNGTPAVEAGEPETTTEEPEVIPEAVEETSPAPPAQPAPKEESTTITPAQPTPVATPPPQQAVTEKPVAPAPAAAPAPASTPAAPPKVTTWANIVGSTAKPAAPVTSAAPQVTQSPQAVQPAQTTTPSTTAATATTPTSTSSGSGQGWQSVSESSRRHTRPAAGDLQNQVFVRNVNESVDINSFKEAMSKFGSVKNVEHNKLKNCAIVEFDNSNSVKQAIAGSHIRVGNREIQIEERKAPAGRMNGPGYGQRNAPGGQRGGDGRQGQGRGGYPRAEGRFEGRDSRDGGRGGARGGSRGGSGFPSRGRGTATTST